MSKLLKYEMRRSRVMLFGLAGITILMELLYLVGWFFEVDALLVIGILGGLLIMSLGSAGILLYSVVQFHADISKKPGYLLLSTPRSAAQIIGSKLLLTMLSMMGMFLLFFLLIWLDVWMALRRAGTSIVDLLSRIDTELDEAGLMASLFNGYNAFGVCMYLLAAVFSFLFSVTIAYAIIVLLKTTLGNRKGSTPLGILIWFAATYLVSTLSSAITNLLRPDTDGSIWISDNADAAMMNLSTTELLQDLTHTFFHPAMYLPQMLLSIVFAVGGYLLTSWLMEKKLSV